LYINLPPVIKTLQASGLYTSTCLNWRDCWPNFLDWYQFQFILLCFHFNSLLSQRILKLNLSVVCICSSTISGHGDTAVN